MEMLEILGLASRARSTLFPPDVMLPKAAGSEELPIRSMAVV